MSTNRRGFFGRLLGKREFVRGCFAVQVVINAYGEEGLREKLHELIDEAHDIDETPIEKKRFYKRLSSVLLGAEPYFEHASFEYEDHEKYADESFTEWVSELEANIATEEEEVGDEVDGYHRLSSENRYVVFTMVFLLTAPHPFADKYDGENEDDYTRRNLGELIDSVNYLDFEDVESDAVFLMPGNNRDGFSWADLADEGWEHLKMVRSS